MESKKNLILDNKYLLKKKLGDGATADVFLCEDKNTQQTYAAKILKKEDSSIQNEIKSLSVIHNENIINLVSFGEGLLTNEEQSKKVSYIILEYCEKGELFNYVFYPQKGFDEYFGRAIFKIILNGIASIHKNGFAHRDLKMENIMLNKDYIVKIADFGFTISIENGLLKTPLGTLNYAAPEILMKKQYDGQIDEILNHPWMKGNYPSDDELLKEFEERDKIVRRELELEELNNEANEENNDGNLFRKENAEIEFFKKDLMPENFDENINKNVINLKTKVNGSKIMNKLMSHLKLKYKDKANIVNNVDKLEINIQFDDDLDEIEEDIEDDEDYLDFVNLNMKIILLQKKGQNEYAISFIKKEGELYDFANRVMEIKNIIKKEIFN